MKNDRKSLTGDVGAPLSYASLEGRLVELRGVPVLLDADVAWLYGVETRAVNQAVRRNLDKFPQGYFFELTGEETDSLRSQIVTANVSPKSRAVPKAFTEKGLYMLATILKSERATAATLSIIETFAIGELEEAPTCKEILQVQIEGTRSISRKQKFYNLDAIISVGYRVNSILGVKFRQWATAVLKEYLLRGSVRDRRLGKLEKRMDAAERAIDTIIYTLTPTLPENRRRIGFGAEESPAPTKPYGKGGR